MLAQLTISNFAIVRELEIDFHSGMTAITGETGAGKSIAIDALGLCLGGRAEADMVRRGATVPTVRALRAERYPLPPSAGWKRISWRAGVSVYLPGDQPTPLRAASSTAPLSRFAAARAGPAADPDPRPACPPAADQTRTPKKTLLDGYTGEYALTQRMAEHYRQWHQSCRELAQHQQQSQERAARADLLQYQLKELNEFNPRRENSSRLTKIQAPGQQRPAAQHLPARPYGTGGRRRGQSAEPALYREAAGQRAGGHGQQAFRRPGYAGRGGHSAQRGQRRVAPLP